MTTKSTGEHMHRFRHHPLGWLVTIAALALPASSALAAGTYWPPIADPPTGQKHPGRMVWAELVTRDVGTAADFYGKVFGWTFETFGPKEDTRTYTLVESGGMPIAGMVFAQDKSASTARDARWIGMISVPNVDAAAAHVTKGGGKVLFAPRDLGKRGRAAILVDPEGALFGVLDSATGDPEDVAAAENQWLWAELWASDPAKMAEFYKGLAGYEVVSGVTPGGSSGFHLAAGGYARLGILPKPAKVPTTWVPYIRVKNVADTVAKARAAGGAIVLEPMQARGTTVALMLDPTGAPVAVAEWTPRREDK